jgi:hypothetical protein
VTPTGSGQRSKHSCFGGDAICNSQGQVLRATGNVQSANGANFVIGWIFGVASSGGVGLLEGLVGSGADGAADAGYQVAQVVFGHGARHLMGTGLDEAAVEDAITAQIQELVTSLSATGNFWGKVVVNGQEVFYRAFTLPNGTISVGTYTVGAP